MIHRSPRPGKPRIRKVAGAWSCSGQGSTVYGAPDPAEALRRWRDLTRALTTFDRAMELLHEQQRRRPGLRFEAAPKARFGTQRPDRLGRIYC